MEKEPTTLDRAVKVSIIAGVLIVALSIGYYLIIFLPKKEMTRAEQQSKLEKAKKECAQVMVDAAKKNAGATSSDYIALNKVCMSSKGF